MAVFDLDEGSRPAILGPLNAVRNGRMVAVTPEVIIRMLSGGGGAAIHRI